jgi:hypothetical protein
VMQLIEGHSLHDVLDQVGRLSAEHTLDVVAQVAAALQAAHAAGVVHRDIKPANLLIRPDGSVVVTDFGIARSVHATGSNLTVTGEVMGTAAYLAPEQAEGKPAGPATDVYSLGIVAYECLAGRRPFGGDTPVATAIAHLRETAPPLPPDVPAPARAVVARAIAKDPAARFASAAALAETARAAAAGHAPALPPATALPPTALLPMPTRGAARGGGGAVGYASVSPGGTTPSGGPVRPSSPPPGRPPAPARGRRTPPSVIAGAAAGVVLALLLGIGIAAALRSGDATAELAGSATSPAATSSTGPSTGPSTEPDAVATSAAPPAEPVEESTPAAITLDRSKYVGRPVDEVRKDLAALGLEVDEQTSDRWGRPGRVVDLSPTQVRPGDTVTLFVPGEWQRRSPKKQGPKHDDEDQQGDDT